MTRVRRYFFAFDEPVKLCSALKTSLSVLDLSKSRDLSRSMGHSSLRIFRMNIILGTNTCTLKHSK